MTEAERERVLVVGGGVIGLFTAYWLQNAGFCVKVIDRAAVGAGSSSGNCGLICPSHAYPLARPGAVRDAMRMIGRRGAPLHVGKWYRLRLWRWLAAFARHCRQEAAERAAAARAPLLIESRRWYEVGLPRLGIECGYRTGGLLSVYRSPGAWEAHRHESERLTARFGIACEPLSAAEAHRIEPLLDASIARAWWYRDDAWLDPAALLTGMADHLAANGVELLPHCPLERIDSVSRSTLRVVAGGECFDVDRVVLATGAWTPALRRMTREDIPIEPGKGYSLTMPAGTVRLARPLLLPETRVAVTPLGARVRVGSLMEFRGYDTSLPSSRLELLCAGARPYVPRVPCRTDAAPWYGWRPMTPSGVPIIDCTPHDERIWVHAGHNMLGLSMAPESARVLVARMTGRDAAIPAERYRLPSRRRVVLSRDRSVG